MNWYDENHGLTYSEACQLLHGTHEERVSLEPKNEWDAYINDTTFDIYALQAYFLMNEFIFMKQLKIFLMGCLRKSLLTSESLLKKEKAMVTKEEMDDFIKVNDIRVLPQKSNEAISAIYITPAGTFLSGVSKTAMKTGDGFHNGEVYRDIDHRCVSWIMDTNPYISNTFWTDMFKKTGFIMVIPEYREYIIAVHPTKEQEMSCKWLEKFGFTRGEESEYF